jgi:hypothetical protein
MICQARIQKEYKTRKADVIWPETYDGQPSPSLKDYPEVCNGHVSVSLKADFSSGNCRCDSYPELQVIATCTRCANPFWPGKYALEAQAMAGELNITDWIDL